MLQQVLILQQSAAVRRHTAWRSLVIDSRHGFALSARAPALEKRAKLKPERARPRSGSQRAAARLAGRRQASPRSTRAVGRFAAAERRASAARTPGTQAAATTWACAAPTPRGCSCAPHSRCLGTLLSAGTRCGRAHGGSPPWKLCCHVEHSEHSRAAQAASLAQSRSARRRPRARSAYVPGARPLEARKRRAALQAARDSTLCRRFHWLLSPTAASSRHRPVRGRRSMCRPCDCGACGQESSAQPARRAA